MRFVLRDRAERRRNVEAPVQLARRAAHAFFDAGYDGRHQNAAGGGKRLRAGKTGDAVPQRAADTGFGVVEGNGADAGNVVAHRYAKAVALLRLLRCQEKLRLFLPALNQKPYALSAGELPDGVRCGRDASAVYF